MSSAIKKRDIDKRYRNSKTSEGLNPREEATRKAPFDTVRGSWIPEHSGVGVRVGKNVWCVCAGGQDENGCP